jgi:hypothetical protein
VIPISGCSCWLVSKTAAQAAGHFGWFNHFAQIDCPASATLTMEQTGWQPRQPGLIDDIKVGGYF